MKDPELTYVVNALIEARPAVCIPAREVQFSRWLIVVERMMWAVTTTTAHKKRSDFLRRVGAHKYINP